MLDCVTNTYKLEVQKTGMSVDDDLDHDVAMAYLAYKTLTETQTVLEGKVSALNLLFYINKDKIRERV